MIDMHCHVLYGIDDGCKTIEESVETIKKMVKIGFKEIILTPHYIENSSFDANNELKKEKLKILKKRLLNENINVRLLLGNEVFINKDIHELIIKANIRTLNNSRYILMELPLNNHIIGLDDYVYELTLMGYKIVIAHPERYTYFQKDYDKLKELYNQGVYFQCNYGSIIEQYGKNAQRLIKKLLKDGMVDFLSTDIHACNSTLFDRFDEVKSKIIKLIGIHQFEKISNDNITKVINDCEINDMAI